MSKTIMLMGIPRSGSTLSCNILNNYENTIALLEPMNAFNINSDLQDDAYVFIDNFVKTARDNAISFNKILTKHINGVIPTNTISNNKDESLRKQIIQDGEVELKKTITENFTLIIKHNAFFVSIIDDLKYRYTCYAIIRNPLSVLCSWNSVDLPVNQGYIPAGQKFDKKLDEKLQNTNNKLERQIIILNWFFERIYKNIDQDKIIRYEDITINPELVFDRLSYNNTLNTPIEVLKNRNNNSLYSGINIQKLYKRLLESDGYYLKFYSTNDIHNQFNQMKCL